jgi:hypothetical protein
VKVSERNCSTCRYGRQVVGSAPCVTCGGSRTGVYMAWEPITAPFVDDPFRASVEAIAAELVDLLCRKQADYGPGNINAFGEKGVVVRMNDKMERLKRLVWGDKEPANESVEDSYKDMGNYAIIALMVRRGVWPK